MGSGAVGACLGVRLAADGNEVVFIDRGPHREAIQAEGLRVVAPELDLHVHPAWVHADPASTGFCDFILFCVWPGDTAQAASVVSPLIAHDSAVLCLQHGIDGSELVREQFGDAHVLGGFVELAAHRVQPAVVRQESSRLKVVFGELDGQATWRQECLLAAFLSAGIQARVSGDIQRETWCNFAFQTALAASVAVRRSRNGDARGDARAWAAQHGLFDTLFAEGRAVAAAGSCALGSPTTPETPADARRAASESAAFVSLDAAHREARSLLASMMRAARRFGVSAPVCAQVLNRLEERK